MNLERRTQIWRKRFKKRCNTQPPSMTIWIRAEERRSYESPHTRRIQRIRKCNSAFLDRNRGVHWPVRGLNVIAAKPDDLGARRFEGSSLNEYESRMKMAIENPWVLLGQKPVANTGLCDQVLRVCRVCFEFPPQLTHEHSQVLAFLKMFWSPDFIQQLALRQDLAVVAQQHLKKLVFVGCEMDFHAADKHAAGDKIDADVSKIDGFGTDV